MKEETGERRGEGKGGCSMARKGREEKCDIMGTFWLLEAKPTELIWQISYFISNKANTWLKSGHRVFYPMKNIFELHQMQTDVISNRRGLT
jgi:hypothetical protein